VTFFQTRCRSNLLNL